MKIEFLEAVHSREPVSGLTHAFYRYPARFSPLFARAAIRAFTEPGDLILDPFMGGGTTLVEACTLGRRAIGVDANSLAVFVSKAKTTELSGRDISEVRLWGDELLDKLNLRRPLVRATDWAELGYQRNISGKSTWPIRKTLELALAQVSELPRGRQQRFARCVLLRTAQWALDCRSHIPSAKQFRERFRANLAEMIDSAKEYAVAAREADRLQDSGGSCHPVCLHRSTVGLESDRRLGNYPAPALILTSPPYPGVHVLYHRWQVQGRRETPAPYWIVGSLDGNGAGFYAFGDRRQLDLRMYYEQAHAAFRSLACLADATTLIVQMVAFSDPVWQLPEYLSVMQRAGFRETRFRGLSNSPDGRLWRHVPNRKWYANQRSAIPTNKEVVLFHRLA